MTQKEHAQLLAAALEDLQKATKWLERSYQKCQPIAGKKSLTDDDLDKMENLTSRFARATDLLIQKVYRTVDIVEFESNGTLIDVINRSHKRNLFESVEDIRSIKDLRNEISHDYAHMANLSAIFKRVVEKTPALFALIDRALQYCLKHVDSSYPA